METADKAVKDAKADIKKEDKDKLEADAKKAKEAFEAAEKALKDIK